jgi:hypothetical protein
MKKPTPQSETDVFIPSWEDLEQTKLSLGNIVPSNFYGGDWKIILFVLFLSSSLYFCGTWLLLLPWIDGVPYSPFFPIPDFMAVPLSLFVFFLYIMMLISYFVAVFSQPGSPPPNWSPLTRMDGLDPQFDPFAPKRKIRWCELCENYKPPRAHHCRRCGICVIRGDHHCMWTSNCIGFRNHKAFFLFLTYLSFLIWFGIFLSILWIANTILTENDHPRSLIAVFLFCLVCLCVQSGVGSFFNEQVQLLFADCTTIEKRDLNAWRKCYEAESKSSPNTKKLLIWPLMASTFGYFPSLFHDGIFTFWLPTLNNDLESGTSFSYHPKFVHTMLKTQQISLLSTPSTNSLSFTIGVSNEKDV